MVLTGLEIMCDLVGVRFRLPTYLRYRNLRSRTFPEYEVVAPSIGNVSNAHGSGVEWEEALPWLELEVLPTVLIMLGYSKENMSSAVVCTSRFLYH